MEFDPLSKQVIGLAIEVHRNLGPGLLESAYQQCLVYELQQSGLHFEKELVLPVRYKEIQVPASYRIDILVENKIVLELKVVEEVGKIHIAQLLTYMRLGKYPIGILFNFNVSLLKDGGIKRFVL